MPGLRSGSFLLYAVSRSTQALPLKTASRNGSGGSAGSRQSYRFPLSSSTLHFPLRLSKWIVTAYLLHHLTLLLMPERKTLSKKQTAKLERIAFILKTVAHPLRLGIVHLLEQHPQLSVSEICSMLESEQSLTSHHLQNMRLRGILRAKRSGRSVLYSLKEPDVSLIITCLENCKCNM